MKFHFNGIALRLGSELTVRLCGFVTLPLLTRSLGSDGYGVIVGTGTIVGFLAAIGSFGLSYHVGRIVGHGETVHARRLLRQLITLAGLSGIGLALALGALSPWLNDWFLRHDGAGLAIALAGGSLIASCVDGVLLEWLRQRDRFRSLSLLQGAAAIFQLILIIIISRSGWGPAAIVACASVVQLSRVAVMAAMIRLTSRAPEIVNAKGSITLATCIRDGFTLTLGSLGSWGLNQGGRLILGNAAAIGGYGAAAALSTVAGVAGSACGLQLYPALVRAVAAQRPRAAMTSIRRYSTTFQTLTLPALFIAIAVAGDAIRLIAGHAFFGLGIVCSLLLIAGWIEMLALPMNYLLSAHGWASRTRNAQLGAAIFSLGAACVVTPFLGAVGVATAALVGQLATLACMVWGLRHTRFSWRALVPHHWIRILGASLLAGTLASVLPTSSWLGLLSTGIASLASAALVIFIIGILRKRGSV